VGALMDELQHVDRTSVERFLRRWYDHSAPAHAATDPVDELPATMADWYAVAGARLSYFARYYRFLEAAELDRSGNVVAFCAAPHDGEFWWGYAGDGGADPLTFESDDSGGWNATGFKLSELLLYIVVSSAVLDADCGLVNMTAGAGDFESAVALLEPLAPPIWAWPDPNVRFYSADGIVAQAGKTGEEFGYQIVVAADSDERLAPFGASEWEWDSRA
jgi:hypothetical protein